MSTKPSASTKSSRSESVLTRLREMILAGAFEGGFHLQEIPLAEQMGVSRTPIREALVTLAREGLLEPGPKRGYKIRMFELEDIVNAYEVRATLEGMACRVLAERGLSKSLQEALAACLDSGDEMLRQNGSSFQLDHVAWLDMNNTFHTLLVSGTGNRMLQGFAEQSQTVPLASARQVHWYRTKQENYGLATRAHQQHREIVDAILRRQAGRAEARMREHIYSSQELMREYFKRNVGTHLKIVGTQAVRQANEVR